jgi:hypothetical protein
MVGSHMKRQGAEECREQIRVRIRRSGIVSVFTNYYCGDDVVGGNVARMGKMRSAYRIAGVKFEGNRPLRRPRCRDDIKIDLTEVRYEGVG